MPKIAFTMEAKKLLYSFLVVAPVLALAGIGLHSRTYVDPFEWPQTGGDQLRINSYLDVVRDTDEQVQNDRVTSPDELRRIARRWIKGAGEGELKPLVPVSYDDMIVGGVKSQIFNSMVAVERGLMRQADGEVGNGDFRQATNDLLMAVHVAETLKYSNFLMVYRCSMMQHMALNRLDDMVPYLDSEQKSVLRKSLKKICRGTEPLNRIAHQAKMVYTTAVRLHENTEEAIRMAEKMVPSRSFFEQPALAKSNPAGEAATPVTETLMFSDLNNDAVRALTITKELEDKIAKILSSN
ncbi:MAG: hypothetical protein J0H02_20505 [Armatimonadetes bacterium]|nr:hypothetical protein [Armatimonadota bacterium]